MKVILFLVLCFVVGSFQDFFAEGLSCSDSPCVHGSCIRGDGDDEDFCRCDKPYGDRTCNVKDKSRLCYPSECQNQGTCVTYFENPTDHSLTWTCRCPQGFYGRSCEHVLSCGRCERGKCKRESGTILCKCDDGFTGPDCDKVDYCSNDPCLHGGTCINKETEHECLCTDNWSGATCKTDVNECSKEPGRCGEGKSCVNLLGSYVCCSSDFSEPNCNLQTQYSRSGGSTTPCSSNPCNSNGICTDLSATVYDCACNPGFQGADCSTNIDDCASGPCKNGATCTDGANNYFCTCTSGWTGSTCEEDVDECTLDPNTCLNGATCYNSAGTFQCTCVNGWEGTHCNVNVDDCQDFPCFYGSTCVDEVGTFSCICSTGKSGILCQLDDACLSTPPPCAAEATCNTNPVTGAAICNCPQGYTGVNCLEDIDECELGDNPCAHSGSCVNTPGSFTCHCMNGYSGPRCETNINECESSPCLHDATCLDQIGTYKCVCMQGYTGDRCELEINECDSNPCMHDAECFDKVNMYVCQCDTGFTGPNCETNIDDCASTPCQNHLRCEDGINSYTCVCQSGFVGTNCEVNIDECSSSPCHYGNCSDGVNQFTCDCEPGYEGVLCQLPIDECAPGPCLNGGTCTDKVADYECTCPLGTSGKNCEVNNDECGSPDPCIHGVCVDGINTYTCDCDPGYTGTLCEADINECASSPCHNGGTCENRVNGYICHCLSGFSDSQCYSNIDECSGSPCLNGGTCQDGINKYTCSCQPGYEGENCQHDIDECASAPCQNGAYCLNQVNKYTCQCRVGYAGINCQTEINECSGHPCLNGGTCSDLVGMYQCACLPGFTDINCGTALTPCDPSPCENNGECTPTPDFLNFVCTCPSGFQGATCAVDINECVKSPCLNGGRCRNQVPGYTCECRLGFTGDNCAVDIDDCSPEPCMNGGTCYDDINAYKCLCEKGFVGERCESDHNECSSNPCQNGATCTDYVNSFVCDCMPGFRGENCEENIDECSQGSCLNGGVCNDGINGYTCACVAGFSGQHCERDIDECASSPCKNGATCDHVINAFICRCPYGYTGSTCSELVDRCLPSPCLNGGSCSQTGTEFRCLCPVGHTGVLCDVPSVSCAAAATSKNVALSLLCGSGGQCNNVGATHQCTCATGYTGSYCETNIDDCASNPCLNGATCNDHTAGYSCNCLSGYQGTNCQDEINECASGPCQNGGSCIDLVNTYSCTCPVGTSGSRCEVDFDDCADPNTCLNGGSCVDNIGGFSCTCLSGYAGPRCQGDVNECLSNPCDAEGTLDCIQGIDTFTCNCKEGYTGDKCEKKLSSCSTSPCLNGATCTDDTLEPTGYRCTCDSGFRGTNCEISMSKCSEDYFCYNGGTCQLTSDGIHICQCPKNFNGDRCIYSIPGEPTGPGTNNVDFPVEIGQNCPDPSCVGLRENGDCDAKCNSYDCQYDGGDCSLGITDPFSQCPDALQCQLRFHDGSCDEQCNTEECLFDGRDCETPYEPCPEQYNDYCSENYNNGHCDKGCDTYGCGYDGLDCEGDYPKQRAAGVLIIIVVMSPSELLVHQTDFLRSVGQILGCIVEFELDSNGQPKIEAIYPEAELSRKRRSLSEALWDVFNHEESVDVEEDIIWSIAYSNSSFVHKRLKRASGAELSKAFLLMNNQKCKQTGGQCIDSADVAASYIGARSATDTLTTPYSLNRVSSTGDSQQTTVDYTYIVGPAIGVILVVVIIGVLTQRKRKRESGNLWIPEGFQLNKKQRKEPIGQADLKMKTRDEFSNGDLRGDSSLGMPFLNGCYDENRYLPQKNANKYQVGNASENGTFLTSNGSAGTYHSQSHLPCNRDDALADDGKDNRKWTPQHLEAADLPRGDSASAVTDLTPPPQVDANADVNARGPDGMTPLMIASVRGGGVEIGLSEDTSEESSGDTSGAVEGSDSMIAGLLLQGASLGAQTERTGETALHLAARFARADAAKRLLDAGADANIKDHTGRTPLHAAVAADAQGVFQILLRNRATDLDAKTNDGTTPMILASRLAVEGMVDELINASADINAVDAHCKSALHWAAAVNNVDALNTLLRAGCNRDAQTEREETPLFLASKEGSYEAVTVLLDHFANRDITDHMDRLPRDIAQERMHTDIVQLLDEYNLVRSPSMQGGHMSHMNGMMRDPYMAVKPHGGNKKSRRQAGRPDGKASRRQKKTASSQVPSTSSTNAESISPNSADTPPNMGVLMHHGMGHIGENSLSPGNTSLSSPATTYSADSSLSPPSSMGPASNGSYHPMQQQQMYNQQGLMQGPYGNMQNSGMAYRGTPPRLSHLPPQGGAQHMFSNRSVGQHPNSHTALGLSLGQMQPGQMQQEWNHRNEMAMQQNQQMYNTSMQQAMHHPSQFAAYKALGVPPEQQQNGIPDRAPNNQRRYAEAITSFATKVGNQHPGNLSHQHSHNGMNHNGTPHNYVHPKPASRVPSHQAPMNTAQSPHDQMIYPTPPSQTMSPGSDNLSPPGPPPANLKQMHEAYETPSPDSSDHWSSYSPSNSDSSEGIRSPTGHHLQVGGPHHPHQQNLQVYPHQSSASAIAGKMQVA